MTAPAGWIYEDFIRWEQLPCALAPEDACDFYGCFSGTALEWEGKHILMYTGATKAELFDGTILNWQKQCIARGDGINYQKEPQNPVISSDQLPKNAAVEDFRDPKLWRENGEFYALIGSMMSIPRELKLKEGRKNL